MQVNTGTPSNIQYSIQQLRKVNFDFNNNIQVRFRSILRCDNIKSHMRFTSKNKQKQAKYPNGGFWDSVPAIRRFCSVYQSKQANRHMGDFGIPFLRNRCFWHEIWIEPYISRRILAIGPTIWEDISPWQAFYCDNRLRWDFTNIFDQSSDFHMNRYRQTSFMIAKAFKKLARNSNIKLYNAFTPLFNPYLLLISHWFSCLS